MDFIIYQINLKGDIMKDYKKLLWITQYFLMKYMQGKTEFDERDFIENSYPVFNGIEIRVIRKWWTELLKIHKENEMDYLESILILEQYLKKNDKNKIKEN